MLNEEAFLAAIREVPDDDALRFVYADWLEDRGDPRAEFLRMECLFENLSRRDGRYAEQKTLLRAMGSRVGVEWAASMTRSPIWLEPEHFYFASDGWVRLGLYWRDEQLTSDSGCYWEGERLVNNSEVIFPSSEEWRAFWSIMDELQSWEWAGNYGSGVLCGTPWVLKLRYRGRALACAGNGFEGEYAPPRFQRIFRVMCRLFKLKIRFPDEGNA